MSEGMEFLLAILFCFCLGYLYGFGHHINNIEIQEVTQVDNGYYITINNEIYYKEVEKDVKD